MSDPEYVKRIFQTVRDINATIKAQERRRGEHTVSDIEDTSNKVGGIITEQGGQSSAVSEVKQELSNLLAEQLQRFGSGATSEAIAAAMEQCDTISGQIGAVTVELESLQEALGAIAEG